MRTRHLMALFTGVLILAIILPISLSIWQAARQAKMQFYRELDDYSKPYRRSDAAGCRPGPGSVTRG
ncbi:cyclic diguanylate phosphodiesterase (EAL) domain-containing protein [Klebsiella pneumoniae]|uniref:Cyclic diguanylate phosphodiesterase (EAL) domain-containing protein n=1 Tax=Klebsiella pneumoniae TaxID=573 RepID=A0A2X3FK48_KLEPN|nr:cyclic diguanylate phosphodiesterase (EAL) domain-containing protein [Klebsiella pneumoniae]